jgi:hypothetical protein
MFHSEIEHSGWNKGTETLLERFRPKFAKDIGGCGFRKFLLLVSSRREMVRSGCNKGTQTLWERFRRVCYNQNVPFHDEN